MDVQKILLDKLERLPVGKYSDGLRAVRLHVEAAIRHFMRGQKDGDETLFTDAIYRCNQAFEGSVKEAYRVLASKNPDKIAPAEIEAFLSSGGILRKRVLDQFTNYRREWRNPSTHNYMLDFDEDEALLAIVSVAVFSIVLCDQIEGKLAFVAAQSAPRDVPEPRLLAGSLLDRVAELAKRFAETFEFQQTDQSSPMATFLHAEGALGGFLSAEFSGGDVKIRQNAMLQGGRIEVDLIVESGEETVAIDLKVSRHRWTAAADRALLQMHRIVTSGAFSGGVALVVGDNQQEYVISTPDNPSGTKIRMVSPQAR